jgi:hypothetical protein
MRFDWRALALAVVLEVMLLVLAAFGGPHGVLGGWPWMLQFPGILLVYAVPGDSLFLWRVVAGTLLQVALWYAFISLVRRRRSRTDARVAATPIAPPDHG